MNNSTKRHYKTIAEIGEESGWSAVLRAYEKYGLHSIEFEKARLRLQEKLIQSEVEYQKRKAANRARLYEEGY